MIYIEEGTRWEIMCANFLDRDWVNTRYTYTAMV